jgi:integrase
VGGRTRAIPSALILRPLLLTGCRLREILNLRWEEFDRERGMLFLPDSKTGRKPLVGLTRTEVTVPNRQLGRQTEVAVSN